MYITNPYVYAQLQQLFLPEPPPSSHSVAPRGRQMVRRGECGGPCARGIGRMCSTVCDGMRVVVDLLLHPLLRLTLHILMLPLLPFVTREFELASEARLRESITKREMSPTSYKVVVWLFPAGRVALWFLSSCGLAWLLTTLQAPPPSLSERGIMSLVPTALPSFASLEAFFSTLLSHSTESDNTFAAADCLLALYAVGWAVAEAADLQSTAHRQTYFRDVFNRLDLALIVAMVLTIATRVTSPTRDLLTLPCQAAAAMIAWLRLTQVSTLQRSCAICAMRCLPVPPRTAHMFGNMHNASQVLYIWPSSGPLLIMALRMLSDLFQFLTLATFVVFAFAAAFFVLLRVEGVADAGAVDDTDLDPLASLLDAEEVPLAYLSQRRALKSGGGVTEHGTSLNGGKLSFMTVLTVLAEGTMDGEPDRIMALVSGAHLLSSFAWILMALFGIIVVLLLLNLLIARFAKTFDMVYENLDANFKVNFAPTALVLGILLADQRSFGQLVPGGVCSDCVERRWTGACAATIQFASNGCPDALQCPIYGS